MLKAKKTYKTEKIYTLDLAPKDPWIFRNSLEQRKKTNCKTGGIKVGAEVDYEGETFAFYDWKKGGEETEGAYTLISQDGTQLVKWVNVEKIP